MGRKRGSLDDIFGPTDEFGMRPRAARQRIAVCARFDMEPDPLDVECVERDDAKAAARG